MELRPLLITRVASMLPGAVVIGFGVEWWFDATAGAERLGAAVLAAVGVTVAIRGHRLGVRYDSKTLTVRGMFRTRRISKSTIRGITVFPAIRWTTRSGRTMWTPIIAFAELGRVLPPVASRNEEAIEELDHWLAPTGEARATHRHTRP